ncbi:molybdopterin-dependent oxidoreductase [Arthrobacter sp. zg-Y20]|uniref:molybdopterin-dependent oxidoreductase n=1 Tax=unclassified Arthrobacter TaxID=235627 RepID=UPI001D13FEAF|nr:MULTISPECIES: molybdopterin-dependent oxidoreductase [unclassified Arthrobacter]MCC3277096.1 molybdopterin-dependent oxidoreductase [Arthrobacter sp. zg-Y20]MDK1317257.1 molybdopterin-dependent oxidoreductase [Arthrobacter sp. zg.Y20]WIB07346.1 molybdopterin-dependent oxidoreductase [Arthrobacter sp. zg-Y20]
MSGPEAAPEPPAPGGKPDGTPAERPAGKPAPAQRRIRGWAAGAGLVAACLGIAAGELFAAFLSPSLSPVSAVGSVVINAVPGPVKDAAIALFGTADKAALLAGMGLIIALAAIAAGVLELRRPPAGSLILGAFGAAGLAAVLTRPQSAVLSIVPPLAAAVVAVMVLRWLAVRVRALAAAPAPADAAVSRRAVLVSVGGGALVALLGAALAGIARGGQAGVAAVRDAVRLPSPARAAAPIPAGAELAVDGLTPLVTDAADFYRIDTALSVPAIDPENWRLRVTGMVDREVELSYADLLAKPLQESFVTLACVSNEVGGNLIGNARWLGWPVRELLASAGVRLGADMVLSTSNDGWSASTPLEALTDSRDALLAVGMNGEPLPLEHGFPVRLVVPGLYGYVSATKWVTELRVTRFADDTAYWTERGWGERGPVKLSSRIDVPGRKPVQAGTVTVAGVAWAQHTGISAVQVRVDDGDWQDSELAAGISADTWRQYRIPVDLSPGGHDITVRAVDANGTVQTDEKRSVLPDGATGLHTIRVTVR